jgi:dynein heavy chain
LQTKLSNPHYKPEIAAQTTLVNFCVTEKGLEDQLLALVVDHERPDLQKQAGALVRQLAEYTITLKELEDSLLFRLANAQVGLGMCEESSLLTKLLSQGHRQVRVGGCFPS